MSIRNLLSTRKLIAFGIFGVLAACLALTVSPSADATTQPRQGGSKPTIVLVHGAWADGSSWDGVIQHLKRAGYTVLAPPNPLQGLSYDSAAIADFLTTVSGPVVLVGHSYGGAVITNAAVGDSEVKALVYVDAFMPAQGETVFQLAAAQPGSCLSGSAFNLAPYPGAPTGDADVYLKSGPNGPYPGFRKCFANDLSATEAATLDATQRPAALNAGTDQSGVPAWQTIPSWDVIGMADHVIPPAEQLFMANRAHSHITEIRGGSHLSLISHSGTVAKVIMKAARAVS